MMRSLLGGRRRRQRPDQLGFGDTVSFYRRGTLTHRGRVNYLFSFDYGQYYEHLRYVLMSMTQP